MPLPQSIHPSHKRTSRTSANLSAETNQTFKEWENWGKIAARAEQVLSRLAAHQIMSLDQIARSYFGTAKNPQAAARGYLYKLRKSQLVDLRRRGKKVWHLKKVSYWRTG